MPTNTLQIGWAETDITPEELPVFISGQFHARISEGVQNPLKATALVIQSSDDYVIFAAVDTVSISPPFYEAIRAKISRPEIDPQKIIVNATHTHTAPLNRTGDGGAFIRWKDENKELELHAAPPENYVEFAATRIAAVIEEAWANCAPGGIAFGQDYAVIGRNRRWVDTAGISTMYGLNDNTKDRFHHIEGYEDHSLNLLATYDAERNLTGLIVNVPSPSQETEHLFELSADYWHETRLELRGKLGENLFILPQCSAAGELTPHLIFETKPHQRMLELRGRTGRQEIAARLTECVQRILPAIEPTIETTAELRHHHATLQLPSNALTEADAEDARQNQEEWLKRFEEEKQHLLDNPDLLQEPHWYVSATRAYSRAAWYGRVIDRFEKQKTDPYLPAEAHIVRLGDIAFATNPFEYYLDFGIQIKVKSPALQTFIVQLAGNGTYVPSPRAAGGGGYGAVPASNPIGPEGGQQLADWTVEQLKVLFPQ